MKAAPLLRKRSFESARQHREEFLRRLILAFNERGYADTTTRRLAAACGVTEPTLYRAFGSKEGIFLAALRAICKRRLARYQTEAEGPGGWLARARRLARLDKQLDAEHPEELRILHNAMGDLANPRLRAIVGRHYRTFYGMNLRMIRRAQAAGELSKDIPERALPWLIWLDMAASMISPMLDLMQIDDLKDPEHCPWMIGQIYAPWAKENR